jgi:hypothetical protein
VRDPIVPSVRDVLRDLAPAFLVGLIEDVLALLRELLADLLTFTTGDVTP